MNRKTKIASLIELIVAIVVLTLICTINNNKKEIDSFKKDYKNVYDDIIEYQNDYHTLNIFKTVIETNGANHKYVTKGKVIRLITDDLSMYSGDTLIRFSDDKFHFFLQDDHYIYDEKNELLYIMKGKFCIFGDKYDIYDNNDNLIAKAQFNPLNTNGLIKTSDDKIIGIYLSKFFHNDYTVEIIPNNTIDDVSILTMIASYKSDQHFDRKSSSSKKD